MRGIDQPDSPNIFNISNMKRITSIAAGIVMAALSVSSIHALRLEKVNYGDFSNWITRNIKESAILGGNTKTIYAIGPAYTINDAVAYRPSGGTPWATSNVYAKVSGVTKASGSVTPFDRGGGNKCAKMETILEKVKVAGAVTLNVIVPGTIYFGRVYEPITSTKNPYSKMEMGIPYTKRPAALVYDYKVTIPPGNTRQKANGLGEPQNLSGKDACEVYVLLQRRWEDAKGNIYAKRVGTGRERFTSSTSGWVNAHQLPIYYGDITKKSFYKPYMGLLDGSKACYARNSKGKLVPVHEIGWDDPNATPTHVMLMMSSGSGEPYVGTVGNTLYVDNLAFGFNS